jgi:hypothetical protein
MAGATTLDEARKVLDPRPLDFTGKSQDKAVNPAFHVNLPEEGRSGFKLPGPIVQLEQRLLNGTRETKLFLSGHVGSGKSTELNRLMIKPEIVQRFSVVPLRFEDQEWATLDSAQVLFRIAGELFQAYKGKLEKSGDKLKKKLETLSDRIYSPTGIRASEGTTGFEISVFFLKFRQDLKLSEKIRRGFREFGDTNEQFLQDLLEHLVDEIENALAAEDGPNELLVVVDDLDKLRTAEQHKDIFGTNLASLLAPPLRIVYTVPTAVRFGDDVRAEIRHNSESLYPIRVLEKAPDKWNPEEAYVDDRIGFFHEVVAQRVNAALIDREAIRLAAIYSGGVLRDFFRLMREAVSLAIYNRLPKLDAMVMRYAIEEERRRESIGMYEPDYDALAHVHQTNNLRTADDRRLLALSRVIEAFNGTVWFEANPVFWSVLEEHEKSKRARAERG